MTPDDQLPPEPSGEPDRPMTLDEIIQKGLLEAMIEKGEVHVQSSRSATMQDMTRAGLVTVHPDLVTAWRKEPNRMKERLAEIREELHFLEQIPEPISDFDFDTANRVWDLKAEERHIQAARSVVTEVLRKDWKKRLKDDSDFAAEEMLRIASEQSISQSEAYNALQRELDGDLPGGLQFDSLRRRLNRKKNRKK